MSFNGSGTVCADVRDALRGYFRSRVSLCSEGSSPFLDTII
jgi:hypothetical protein